MTGIEIAATFFVDSLAPRTFLTEENISYGTVILVDNFPVLTRFDIRCLMLQLAYMESKCSIDLVTGTKLGKYQVTENILKKYGYKDDNGWTGLDGVDEDQIFLSSSGIQDRIMLKFLEDAYSSLLKSDAILKSDSKEIIAGMLAVAYQFQDAQDPNTVKIEKISNNLLNLVKNNVNYYAYKSKAWRDKGDQVDSLGRNGALYFNAGKYAIQNLAADVPAF